MHVTAGVLRVWTVFGFEINFDSNSKLNAIEKKILLAGISNKKVIKNSQNKKRQNNTCNNLLIQMFEGQIRIGFIVCKYLRKEPRPKYLQILGPLLSKISKNGSAAY